MESITLTVGSGIYRPEEIKYGFTEATEQLQKIGIDRFAIVHEEAYFLS
ncbi:hypothetical protein ACFO4L_09605 [Bacillus daqingensis]|uniref:Uncharacterized protein n=1 Tax=Bacillus daqingensis TaxID=872396 RepID=A0ABV9NTV4_9BACI